MKKNYENKNIKTNTILIVLSIALVLLLILTQGEKTTDQNTMSLRETAKTEVEPDTSIINLRILTRHESHEEAINQNTEINNKIINHFKEDYEVISQSYNVGEWTQWNSNTNIREKLGYEVRNMIQIKTQDVEEAGKIITEAFELGAKEVQSIRYELSKEQTRKIQDELYQEAIENANKRAENLAKASGVKITGIKNINPEDWSYAPRTVQYDQLMSAEAKGYEEPIFEPGKQEITSTINIIYSIR